MTLETSGTLMSYLNRRLEDKLTKPMMTVSTERMVKMSAGVTIGKDNINKKA